MYGSSYINRYFIYKSYKYYYFLKLSESIGGYTDDHGIFMPGGYIFDVLWTNDSVFPEQKGLSEGATNLFLTTKDEWRRDIIKNCFKHYKI